MVEYDPSNIGIRAAYYWLAVGRWRCEACHNEIPVCGVILPPGHEALPAEDEADGDDLFEWRAFFGPATLSYASNTPPSFATNVENHIGRRVLSYRNRKYWANFCGFCESRVVDYNLHERYGGRFNPCHDDEAGGITLFQIDEPIACQGTTTYGAGVERILHKAKRATVNLSANEIIAINNSR